MQHLSKIFKRKKIPAIFSGAQQSTPTISMLADRIAGAKSQNRVARRLNIQNLQEQLCIHCPDPTAEERLRDTNQELGQKMVRQENWQELAEIIRTADAARSLTPGSMPVAELISYGARADVVTAAEHAISEIEEKSSRALLDGIEDFEHVLEASPDDYAVACIVAQAHIDIGWAWRGNGWDMEVAPRNRDAFAAHFERASEIIAPFVERYPDSPLVAATHCAQVSGPIGKKNDVADKYEHLIDLNPNNPRPMRAMGNHLLPRWFGSYDQLELEARRTAARTEHIWGAGGYTWVQFDAISCDDTACANLDLPFFIDGLRDILTRRPNAYTANLLAAYCANTIGQGYSGNDEADHVRAQISDCTEWIVREYLTELHPMIWAHAAHGFDNNIRIRSPHKFAASGREDALRIMASLFKSEIAAGNRIVFTDKGPRATIA